jgi:predicted PurR-regulated permease PerM
VELDRAASEATGSPPPGPETRTSGVAAEVQDFVARQSGQALAIVAQLAIGLMLALFLLAAGDTFRRKVARIAGKSLARRRVTIEALDEIDAQIQRYMATLLATNVVLALATWGGLAVLGLPNAGMWGAVTGALHVIPYAGTVTAATAVGLAAFVDAGGVRDALLAMLVVAGIAVVVGMSFATWLQGRAARMHPAAVFVGLLFFGWLWGGWGLLLGVPILAVLKSVADRVDALRPVSELLAA